MSLIEIHLILLLLFVSACSLLLTTLLIRYKQVIRILDVPNERSSHTYVVPRSGGIAIFLAFILGIIIVSIDHSYGFVLPLSGVFLMGLIDDIKPISSKIKLIWIALMAMILYFLGFDIQYLGTFFGKDLILPYWIALPFFIFAVSGFVSSLNLIDGLDGLSSLVSLTILFPFAYMGFKYNDSFLFFTTLVLMSSIGGFLLLNWNPAKIFMGDSGSMFLGFIVAIIIVHAIQKNYITPISTLFLAAIPILDTLIVMSRRFLQHKNPFYADKKHIHHVLLKQQKSTRKTVLLLGLMQALFSYIGLGFKVRDDSLIMGLYILCFILAYALLTPSVKEKI